MYVSCMYIQTDGQLEVLAATELCAVANNDDCGTKFDYR